MKKPLVQDSGESLTRIMDLPERGVLNRDFPQVYLTIFIEYLVGKVVPKVGNTRPIYPIGDRQKTWPQRLGMQQALLLHDSGPCIETCSEF